MNCFKSSFEYLFACLKLAPLVRDDGGCAAPVLARIMPSPTNATSRTAGRDRSGNREAGDGMAGPPNLNRSGLVRASALYRTMGTSCQQAFLRQLGFHEPSSVMRLLSTIARNEECPRRRISKRSESHEEILSAV